MDETLSTQIEEMAVLVRRRKSDLARQIVAGRHVATSELAGILKLEVQLANLRLMQEARELTT